MVLTWMAKKLAIIAQIVENPGLFRLCQMGLSIDDFNKLNRRWLLDANINTVLDIGANVGHFASLIHKILSDVTIYSFEPLEDCYTLLNKRMKMAPRFKAFNLALGDANFNVLIDTTYDGIIDGSDLIDIGANWAITY